MLGRQLGLLTASLACPFSISRSARGADRSSADLAAVAGDSDASCMDVEEGPSPSHAADVMDMDTDVTSSQEQESPPAQQIQPALPRFEHR